MEGPSQVTADGRIQEVDTVVEKHKFQVENSTEQKQIGHWYLSRQTGRAGRSEERDGCRNINMLEIKTTRQERERVGEKEILMDM